MLMNVFRKLLHEVVIPEIKLVRAENSQIKTTLEITNKRLDDLNAQLADQSRRIDTTNQRIDAAHSDLITRIDATNRRIDAVHSDLITRIDTTNDRLNHLYEVIVRREEHDGLTQRLTRLEQKVEDLAARHAA
jgi:predicted  nucleic acid-binding Zn-ribbon protein